MEYKNTIITPKTDFPMKAGLPAREPGMLDRWNAQNLYELMLSIQKGNMAYLINYWYGDVNSPDFWGTVIDESALTEVGRIFIHGDHFFQSLLSFFSMDFHGLACFKTDGKVFDQRALPRKRL